MSNGPRGRSGGSGTPWGDDPTIPEIRRDPTAPVLVAEPFETPDEYEAQADDQVEETTPFSVRMDAWRRHYLPLPDEVVHEYLGEDEYVVHTDHPSFRAFLLKNGFQVIALGAVALVFLVFARGGVDWWTILIFLLLQLILAFLALKRLSDRYTSYVITNLRLIRLSGIFGRKLASIPWTRMTGLGYRQKPMGRVLGYATIFIESANEESGLREFSDINDPAAFHQKILDMVSSKSGQSSKEPPPATRGERKSFMQRRRERRALSEERAKRAYEESAPRKKLKKSESGKPGVDYMRDTGGVYEALSTSDTDTRPRPGARIPPPPPPKPRPKLDPPTPPTGTPVVSDAMPPPPPPPEAPRARFWPGADGPPKPPKPPAEPKPAPTGAVVPPVLPKPPKPPRPSRFGRRSVPRGAATSPDVDDVEVEAELTEPPLVPPDDTPMPQPAVADDEVEAEAVDEDPDDPDDEDDDPRTRPSARYSVRRPPRVDEGESARDALASLRRGQRPVQPVRRPRLPSFGRRTPRPVLPESRQLPAGSDDVTEDTTTPDDTEP